MKAIAEIGGELVAACDKSDSVGIIDTYFPDAAFFTEFERFDRHLEKLKRQEQKVDYVVVCSPNYLHDAHCRFGLRYGANVICEKPVVLNPWNLEALHDMEKESGKRVYTILQLRLHESVKNLKAKVDRGPPDKIYELDLTYLTSRGKWYYASWKGDMSKSGGIATNIGVHFFDLLTWIFGNVKNNVVHLHSHDRAAGYLELEKARVRWFLSISGETLPDAVKAKGLHTYRSLQCDGEEFEFSGGFTELHTRSYENIVTGQGFGLDQVKRSIELAHVIRNDQPVGLIGTYHALASLPLLKHPFESALNR